MKRKSMKAAVAEMMGRFGLDGVAFVDEDGRSHGSIKAKPPKNNGLMVPQKGGGTVLVKKGDRVRIWTYNSPAYAKKDHGKWIDEGLATVKAIGPVEPDGSIGIAYVSDDEPNAIAIPLLYRHEGRKDCRVVEKVESKARPKQ